MRLRRAESHKLRLGIRQQRARQDQSIALAYSLHSGEAGNTAPTQKPEQNRFGLIVGMMRGHHIIGANPCGMLEQERIACFARALLNPRLWLSLIPNKYGVRQRKRDGPARGHFGLARRAFSQTMVDRRD